MSIIIDTFTAGEYTAIVLDNNMVEVSKNGVVFDKPGPWGDYEGARLWAEAIVGKLASGIVDQNPAGGPA